MQVTVSQEVSKTYIYALICPMEGKVKYVGKTNQLKERFLQHLRMYTSDASHKKKNWIKKLLKNNLYPVLSLLEVCNSDIWIEREKYWISFLSDTAELLNISEGGTSISYWTGKKRSQETKDKISQTKKGSIPWNKDKKMSSEFCEMRKVIQAGKKLSQNHKNKISNTLSGIKRPPRTEEHKRNHAEALRRRCRIKKMLKILYNTEENTL